VLDNKVCLELSEAAVHELNSNHYGRWIYGLEITNLVDYIVKFIFQTGPDFVSPLVVLSQKA